MRLITLHSGHLRVTVAPEAGASLVSGEANLAGEWIHLLRPTPPEAVAAGNSSLMASFILAPWSNRLRDARFGFNGRSYQLRANTPEGYAIHGDVRRRPWQIQHLSQESVTLTFDSRSCDDINFPFPFTVRARYSVEGGSLHSELTLTNTGRESMPAGLGFHPYFNRGLTPGEDVDLTFLVARAYAELVPHGPAAPLRPEQDFSKRRALGDQEFDDCFAGWDGRAEIQWPKSKVVARFECSPALGHLILFAPRGQPFFALEPVTQANNGFNLFAAGQSATGVVGLKPEEELRARFGLEIGRG